MCKGAAASIKMKNSLQARPFMALLKGIFFYSEIEMRL
jgi:hypothetical protein